MSSQSIASIRTESAEIAQIDLAIETDAARLAAVIRDLLKVCRATINRMAIAPKLTQDADGDGHSADWEGIRFAGARRKNHKGQSGTWQWYVTGQSAYVTLDGEVHVIDWDGEATDFGGTKGYMDSYTSTVTSEPLEEHLDRCPESAEEIVTALRKLTAEDKRARQTIATEIGAVISRLATAA